MAQRICLNMIVKDEAHVIERCLRAARPHVTDYFIVDTGSTDGTQDLIRMVLSDLPGEVVERPWINFGHNRSEAMELAPPDVDYLLFCDADEEIVAEPGFRMPDLTADQYEVLKIKESLQYTRTLLVRRAVPFRWHGATHEYIDAPVAVTREQLGGLRTIDRPDGARASDPHRYWRDVELLEAACRDDPADTRSAFYLAQSYRDVGEFEKASEWYSRRAAMGGWIEEQWYSRYQLARLGDLRGEPWPGVLSAYLEAFTAQPRRAEPLYWIGMRYQQRHERAAAFLFLDAASHLPVPEDALFVEHAVYDHLADLEAAVALFYLGRHHEAVDRNDSLLGRTDLSSELRELIRRNRTFSVNALA